METNLQRLLIAITVYSVALLLATNAISEEKTKDAVKLRGVSLDDPSIINGRAACPPDCPMDCKDIQDEGYTVDGRYVIYITTDNNRPLLVFCELETNGGQWLVFQRRSSGLEDFYRNWTEYENGFGDVRAEFWLGNFFLHLLLSQRRYILRVDMADFAGVAVYAEFPYFSIGPAISKYNLGLTGFSGYYNGNASDSLTLHNNMLFSTPDQDNDVFTGHCARDNNRGGWWYRDCLHSNLNGVYNNVTTSTDTTNVCWVNWKGARYPLKFAEMKFRPM